MLNDAIKNEEANLKNEFEHSFKLKIQKEILYKCFYINSE